MATYRAPVRRTLFALAFVLAAWSALAFAQDQPLRFDVRLAPGLSKKDVSGRLFVFMSSEKRDVAFIEPGFGGLEGGDNTYTATMEVRYLSPGDRVTLDPDVLAFPRPFSKVAKADWQVMALLDCDHSYAYNGSGQGDLYSGVVRLKGLNPASAGSVSITLNRVLPARKIPYVEGVRAVNFQSAALTRFWGRPVVMRAGVVLPPGYEKGAKRYATVYHVPGYGGTHGIAWGYGAPAPFGGPGIRSAMKRGELPAMIHVFMDPSAPFGHTVFADSLNNGPWGSALVREMIPYLEKRFRMAGPRGRFLMGHSSGGWSTLWLQVVYPDAFNGTWSTAPDPVDFRDFTGINLAANPPENVYRKADGSTRYLVRWGGRDAVSFEDFVRFEQVAGEYGGQFESFNAVFSPRGSDGRPMRMFDPRSGEVDPLVLRHWRKYDISRILSGNASTLAPILKGKLHVWAAGEDTFHLEGAVRLMARDLRGKGYAEDIRIIPGADHGSLLTPERMRFIYRSMDVRYRASTAKR